MSATIIQKKLDSRQKRKFHIRKRVSGDTERPRLSVYRSLSHIYAQVIDDLTGKTLVAASTLSAELKDGKGKKSELAKEVGKLLAKKAIAAKIEAVVFDRNGFHYHGRIAAVAEGAREGGLKF
ncbi:MAG: 50S ribosomal protein L18 [Deltaproteobacteria bacterium]|nr:50S ribosomal protein L18 [Deltaproteobacteria bacterium]